MMQRVLTEFTGIMDELLPGTEVAFCISFHGLEVI